MISNAGLLISYIDAAAKEHGATPSTEIFVRVGDSDDAPLYRVHQLKGQRDLRGFRLVLQTSKVPIG